MEPPEYTVLDIVPAVHRSQNEAEFVELGY